MPLSEEGLADVSFPHLCARAPRRLWIEGGVLDVCKTRYVWNVKRPLSFDLLLYNNFYSYRECQVKQWQRTPSMTSLRWDDCNPPGTRLAALRLDLSRMHLVWQSS